MITRYDINTNTWVTGFYVGTKFVVVSRIANG